MSRKLSNILKRVSLVRVVVRANKSNISLNHSTFQEEGGYSNRMNNEKRHL